MQQKFKENSTNLIILKYLIKKFTDFKARSVVANDFNQKYLLSDLMDITGQSNLQFFLKIDIYSIILETVPKSMTPIIFKKIANFRSKN